MNLDRIIVWRLAEHGHRVRCPLPHDQLERWLRLQWPRLLPDAVGAVLCKLAASGLVAVDWNGWSVRPPESRTRAARAHRNGWDPQQGRAT